MKVILENFGPIKRVEFYLTKDLNVIFGENNIGKSYAITALYIILKHLLAEFGGSPEQHIRRLYRSSNSFSPFEFGQEYLDVTEEKVKLLVTEGGEPSPIERFVGIISDKFEKNPKANSYDVKKDILSVMFDLLEPFRELVSNSLLNSFSSVESLIGGKKSKTPSLSIVFTEFVLHFQHRSGQFFLAKLDMMGTFKAKKNRVAHSMSVIATKTILYFAVGGSPEEKSDNTQVIVGALDRILNNLRTELKSVADRVYFLPASRSGLYQGLSNMGGLLAELSKTRSSTASSVTLPNISEPVADYFLQLSTIKYLNVKSPLAEEVGRIEQEILAGEIEFNEQDKKLYYKPRNASRNIDIAFASSMVSEIAPIVAYCKYVLGGRFIVYGRGKKRGEVSQSYSALYCNLIFIEEPEAHLHPKVQVKLMEFFARLTKHNVKVVMTSHSNYMFNKLSNLLLTGEVEPEKVGSYLMRATPEGSVMDDTVMRAEEEGIVDENFVDVAEQLYNERLAAYDKLNAKQ